MPRILIVEDDDLLLHMYDRLFSDLRYQVLTAGDGQEAFELASVHHPDIVLMDIVMPKMDGLQALAQFKSHAALRKIPVIVITSLTDVAMSEAALAAGATRYVQKSDYKPAQVAELVKEVLGEDKSR